jgi:hypothetical protein
MIETISEGQKCQCCGRELDQNMIKYSTNLKNIRIYRAVYPDIKLGSFCHPCYQKWRNKSLNDPRMCLEKLYCGICHQEEPKAKFSPKFCRLNTPLLREYEKISGKDDIILGPVCTTCFEKYPIQGAEPKVKLEIVKKEKVKEELEKKIMPVFRFESKDEILKKTVKKSSTKHQAKIFYCTWSECSHPDTSNWKAQRHVWNVHLKNTPLYQNVFNTQNVTPIFERLTKEEKKKLSGKISLYISDSSDVGVQKMTPKVKSENGNLTEEICVDLRNFFPNDEFLRIPNIKRITKKSKMK